MAKAKILKMPAMGDRAFAVVETDADGNLVLEAMQGMVGGYLERVCLSGDGLNRLDLFFDEEGKLKGLPCNPTATLLSGIALRNDIIVGDAFVCARDGHGNSVGLLDAQERVLRRRLNDLGV